MKKGLKIFLIVLAILIIWFIAFVIAVRNGVWLPVDPIEERKLTQEEFQNLCTYYQQEADNCYWKSSTGFTSEEKREILIDCFNELYEEIDKKYGISKKRMIEEMDQECINYLVQS